MGARHRANEIIRAAYVGHPIAQRCVHGVFERSAARFHDTNLCAEQFHAKNVQRLALHVLAAHEYFALQAETRGHGRRRYAVLPRAGLGDDALLAHSAGEQDLADRVVDLVRAGVAQVFAFQINFCAADFLG